MSATTSSHRDNYTVMNEHGIDISSNRRDWCLDMKGTTPEAKCSWLPLLNDIRPTSLSYKITARKGYVDYLPDGVSRPTASMKKSQFLVLMTLLGIQWENRGTGQKNFPTGRNARYEVNARNLPHFGIVYIYSQRYIGANGSDTSIENGASVKDWYDIPSNEAIRAMFNCFDVGLSKSGLHIKTHSRNQIVETYFQLVKVFSSVPKESANESLPRGSEMLPGNIQELVTGVRSMTRLVTQSNQDAKDVARLFGLGEIIACWVTPTMVKVRRGIRESYLYSRLDGYKDEASFQLSSIHDHLTPHEPTEMLPDDVKKKYGDDADKFFQWIHQYLEHGQSGILEDLKKASTTTGSGRTAYLNYIKELDQELDDLLSRPNRLLANYYSPTSVQTDKSLIMGLQSQLYSVVEREAPYKAPALGEAEDRWSDFVTAKSELSATVLAAVSARLAKIFAQVTRRDEEVGKRVVVNRTIRGILWLRQYEPWRMPELDCSLSSRWLDDDSTIYIM